ncbi:MAG: hypothetical protein Kapaf2KO_06300 [Candidatus Kapaibacteriales bacterium]
MKIITPTLLDSKISGKGKFLLFDVCEDIDYDADNMPSAEHIPASKFNGSLPSQFEDIDTFSEIVLVCDDSSLSKKTASKLKQNGYTKVSILEGGYQNWFAQGYE